jgi:hypothetical protein
MKTHFLIGLLLLSLTSCSMLTKQGRQEHAYRSYVRKWSLRQDRRKVKYHRTNHLFSPPSQPVTVTQAVPETP